MSLAYIDREGRVQLSRALLKVVREPSGVWLYWRTGRFKSSGYRLWPR